MAGKKTRRQKLGGKFEISRQFSLGRLGFVGLIIPLGAATAQEQKVERVLEIMKCAKSNFDSVPSGTLDRIEEAFYRQLFRLNHKFNAVLQLREDGDDSGRSLIWNSDDLMWEKLSVNVTDIEFGNENVMIIAKTKPGSKKSAAWLNAKPIYS